MTDVIAGWESWEDSRTGNHKEKCRQRRTDQGGEQRSINQVLLDLKVVKRRLGPPHPKSRWISYFTKDGEGGNVIKKREPKIRMKENQKSDPKTIKSKPQSQEIARCHGQKGEVCSTAHEENLPDEAHGERKKTKTMGKSCRWKA